MSKMNIINFSDGIRSEEIQENFEILSSEINRERLSVGGAGIASGLNIVPIVNDNQFSIKISEASIVDKNGEEIFIESQTLNVERPLLIEQKEYLSADINNQIELSEIPYMLDRTCPVQYGNSLLELYSGIKIKYQNSSSIDDYIRVKSVQGKTLTLTGLTRRQVEVKYYYTAKRIDTVYIDEDYKIKIKSSSITSTTPSVVFPDKFKYLIAFIQVESEYMKDQDDIPHAYITIKKDLRSSRNIYTDSNGILYICGVPFTDLHLISTVKPTNPTNGQLWLDLDSATLFVWKAIDKFVYKRNLELTNQHNVDDFNDFETNIDYYLNNNSLKVYINSVELQDSEWDELFGGIPTNIQTIPKNTLSNQFRIYKKLNAGDLLTYTITFSESGFRWVPINKESFVNTKECKVYGVDDRWTNSNYWTSPQALSLGKEEDGYPRKYSYFIFDAENDRNMFFTPDRNETEVMINQMPLHRDQYTELSLELMPTLPIEVQNAISDMFGWDEGKLSTLNEMYDDIGIGIILNNPLDSIYGEGLYDSNNELINEKELYVEININRAVSNVSYKRKLQRSATYVYEDKITIDNTFNTKINTGDSIYRFGENQLEVYLNGLRLVNGIDFKEGSDLLIDVPADYKGSYIKDNGSIYRARGAVSREFEMLKQVHIGDILTYRITTNFYSYDHINSVLDGLETQQEAANAKVEKLYDTTLEFCQNTEATVKELKESISKITGDENGKFDKYLTTESIIPESNLEANLIKRIPQSREHVFHVITFNTYNSIGYDLTNYIREEDFLLIWHRDVANGNIDRMLLPEEDYTILTDIGVNGAITVYLKLTDNSLSNIKTRDKIIIRGIKFGRDGR